MVTAGSSSSKASTIWAAAAASSPAESRIGLRTCSSNRSTARAASSRSARSVSRASDSRSPSGRPNSSRCNAVRTSSMSPAVYRVWPSTSRPIRIPSRSTAWISDAGTPLAVANPSSVRSSASSPASSARFGDRGRQVGVGVAELAADHPPDRLERQPLLLELADPPDARGVRVAVPGDPALPLRLRQEPAGLVVADGVDRDVARGGELLDAVPHDRSLYESRAHTFTPNARTEVRAAAGRRRATMRRVKHARPISLTRRARVRRRDDGRGHGAEDPVRRRQLRRAAVPAAVLQRHRAAARHRAARARPAAVPRPLRRDREQLRRVPGADDVPDARGRLDLRRPLRVLLLRQRDPADGLRGRNRGGVMDARGETCALVRPRPDPPHLRHDQLGPVRRSC